MDNEQYLNSVNLNGGSDFPYLVLNVINDESYPRNPGFQVMHWHTDLQFIYVFAGEIEVVTLSACTPLRQGEGIFINRDVVHWVRKVGSCHYNSFIFPEQFLRFYPGSPASGAVDRIVGHLELPIQPIRRTAETQPVLQALQALARLEEQQDEIYPYAVLVALCTLWLAFSRTVALPEKPRQSSVLEQRTAAFLQYIALHYREEVSLDALAASANVSKSECLRCFRTALHTTPYRYLTEYRLSKAAEQLRCTDAPITLIAAEAGFHHPSHFSQCFREKTGLSPSAYRKQG